MVGGCADRLLLSVVYSQSSLIKVIDICINNAIFLGSIMDKIKLVLNQYQILAFSSLSINITGILRS
jgi:hypothetical protein